MGYKTLFEQIKTVCAWNSLRNTIRLLLGTDDVKQAQLADSLVII